MDTEKQVRQSFSDQARICGEMGSGYMETLLAGLATGLDKSTKTGKRVLKWEGNPEPKADALALRLAGALHALVRRGDLPDLAQYYFNTDRAGEPEFIPLVLTAIEKMDDDLVTWLNLAPQTNEVGRSAILFAGLQVLADKCDLPFQLFELGSSAGLNLQLGNYCYVFSGQIHGLSSSLLKLNPDWNGDRLSTKVIRIDSRRGCDLNPLSVGDLQDCEKLVAYLWPDQPERIARVEVAIEIARRDPPTLDRADAAEWVERMFLTEAKPGVMRVLFHTIAWNYFPQGTKDRIIDAMAEAARKATNSSPLAWLSFEFEGDGNPVLRLLDWPGGGNDILATADPHVQRINWRGHHK